MSSGSPHIKTKKGSAATCHPDVSVFHFCRDGTCTRTTGRKAISPPCSSSCCSCCSVSWVIEASRYLKLLWSQPWRGNTWWRGWGGGGVLLEKKGWSVGKSVPWPTTWMDSLSSSPEDEHCAKAVTVTTWRQSWQTSQPARHLLLERCGFLRWAHWGEA